MNATTTARTVALRCVSATGTELAQITLDAASTFAAAALNAVTGGAATGSMPASRFARLVFNAMAGYETQPDLRAKVTVQHLRTLDHLALTAVTRDIPATITWG